MKHLYFAYGSNMNSLQMNYRCPNAKVIGVGVLHNYQLCTRKYADVEYKQGKKVHGVLWEITDEHLSNLDTYEGYPTCYGRIVLPIHVNNEIYKAIVYVMTSKTVFSRYEEPFSLGYQLGCYIGAMEHHVPIDPAYYFSDKELKNLGLLYLGKNTFVKT